MAKTSKVVKNNKRLETVGFYQDRRKELLKVIKDPNSSYDEKREAQKKIAKMPRDASASRHRNRCEVTGRPRGTLRKFGMSRNTFRDLALKGELPGIKKAFIGRVNDTSTISTNNIELVTFNNINSVSATLFK